MINNELFVSMDDKFKTKIKHEDNKSLEVAFIGGKEVNTKEDKKHAKTFIIHLILSIIYWVYDNSVKNYKIMFAENNA